MVQCWASLRRNSLGLEGFHFTQVTVDPPLLGRRYIGAIMNGKKHGRGVCWYAENGVQVGKYSGDFAEGCRHGIGTFTYVDGSVYVGEFRLGRSLRLNPPRLTTPLPHS